MPCANHNDVALTNTPGYASSLDPTERQFGELAAFVVEGGDLQTLEVAAVRDLRPRPQPTNPQTTATTG